MRSNAFYIRALLGVVAITALVIVLFGRKQSGSTDFWLPSSFNAAPRGHKALYTTLDDLHWPVARWQSSYRDLSGTGQVLLLARNSMSRRYPLQPTEIDQLLRWVEAGNRLILLGDFADAADARPLLEKIGFNQLPALTTSHPIYEHGSNLLARERGSLTLNIITPMENSAGALKIQLESCAPLPPLPASATVLCTNTQSTPYAAYLPYGQGGVAWVASASLIDNVFLSQALNLPFVLGLLQPHDQLPEKIWFEEAHHGYRTTFALAELLEQPGVRLASAQIAIGLLVFLSSQLVRFGPVRPLSRQTPRSTLEFIGSLANLYRRADIRNDIVRGLFHDTHQAILKRFDLPPDTNHDLLAQRLKETHPQLPGWKKLAQRFDSTDYIQGLPPSGWLKVSRELILIKNEML